MRRYFTCCASFVVLSAVVGCSGGGSRDSAPVAAQIRFSADRTQTVFPDGSVAFFVQAADGSPTATCLLDGQPADPCLVSSYTGEIRFENLTSGRHEIVVEATTNGTVEHVTHVLEVVEPSVLVYGATPGGIMAAVAAARDGATVALLEPTAHVGGMMSGGLSKSDIGARGHEVITGLAAQFFERVRAAEEARGVCPGTCSGLFHFEPQVATQVFEDLLADAGVVVERNARLRGVQKEDRTLLAVESSRGVVAAHVFIDASYEGDLMAAAGASYVIGREARTLGSTAEELALQEDHAGVMRYRLPRGLHVDPYVVPGDPQSGTLPYIEERPQSIPREGAADGTVMAYTYRLCVTDDPTNRIPFRRPDGFDPQDYEAHARLAQAWAETGVNLGEQMFNPERTVLSRSRSHYKYDLNGGSTFSTDMTAPWLNQAYVEADENERARIRADYRRYIEGLLYTWQTDKRFGSLNEKVARFGLCADEFKDQDGWPHQLYVRVARRMVGEYVMNENDVVQNDRRPPIEDLIAFGFYGIDMHTHRYMAAPVNWPDGTRRDAITIEGFQIVRLPDHRPYPVSYRAITPRASELTNLLNPVTLSATYVAYSSLRMEPLFMMLGEAAGHAAALASERQVPVQAVPYPDLRARLNLRFPID